MLIYYPAGDSAIIIKAGESISPEINRVIRSLLDRVTKAAIPGVTDFIPSYNELMICYDDSIISYVNLLSMLRSLEQSAGEERLLERAIIEVPVLYDGPDLEEVAAHNKLTIKEVIELHSAPEYLVYMLGFTPGFCYLGGMDPKIATPRKATPRVKIPAGSVGIADMQTGIYPLDSPGGWQLIGRTPLRLFDPSKKPEFLFRIGDRLRFRPVTEQEFNLLLINPNPQ